ncbi:MAG TPA: amylo-alpha-1,6-glucosidase [Acidobacteriaceae bacterium]|nr:amylo-alpha-1,6-glucosidase [Acidobacteriaceae bacterium]
MNLIEFGVSDCRDLTTAKKREWLVTNGIGGYSSSTVAGMNTRRYHGLLVAATKPPLGRIVMLSQLEDAILVDGKRFDLSTNMYAGNVVYPAGHMNLTRFQLEPYPVFTYAQDDWELNKSIFMVYGENTAVVEYAFKRKATGENVSLEIRPLIAFRDYHWTTRENSELNRTVEQRPEYVEVHPYQALPRLYLAHDSAIVQVDGYWYKNFEYEEERARGLDFIEDLFSPLVFKADMKVGSFALIASTEPRSTARVAEYRRAELSRRSIAHFNYRANFGRSDLIPTLYRAAEQFIVARAPFKTLLAGYHWFTDWGRDAMISLPGLLLSTDHPDLARGILLEYVRYIDGGMLPNRFPDSSDSPEYNTVDATLWFFEAVRQYLAYRKDGEWRTQALQLIRESLYAPLKGIVRAHISGTRFGIHADQEGFLWAGDGNVQLTWMDARVGGTSITPRAGRPVEIQALWHNALCVLEELGRMLGDHMAADSCAELAGKLRSGFERIFWLEQESHLRDVAGLSEHDNSLRPNQIFAVSLHYPLLKGDRARSVVRTVEKELLTPYGLRTLSPKDEKYHGRYQGDVWGRDSAYHQGTVWPWLAGPFFFAKLNASDSVDEVLAQIHAWLDAFAGHLREAGLGQISEIFDGDYPHSPHGCIAQAWSVAEILRLAKMVSRHPAWKR